MGAMLAPDITLLPISMLALALLAFGWDLLPRRAKPGLLRPRDRAPRRGPEEAGLHSRLQELEATVKRLRDTGHSVVAQRDAARAEAASLRLALGAAQQELTRVREHREAELRAAARLPMQLPAFTAPEPADAPKFRAARLAFAKLCHPDRAGNDAERALRTQLFKEVWAELDRIEKG